ncbi:Hypothetical protein NTJ_13355 [Nesidiocoris tenuis]|uniref:Uncharacterized protein n=1 Tax=Nesidiocoris tenuis TaxID=355587 RepID=A0ABN7B8G1_9HEMI|nr:Hypothetical protein NTJ_13355 [Nesidiocoris tenuis]
MELDGMDFTRHVSRQKCVANQTSDRIHHQVRVSPESLPDPAHRALGMSKASISVAGISVSSNSVVRYSIRQKPSHSAFEWLIKNGIRELKKPLR